MVEKTRYRCVFDRIGRTHTPDDLVVDAADADDLAEQVHHYASRFLASSDVTVNIDLGDTDSAGAARGVITTGFNNGGSFTATVQQ